MLEQPYWPSLAHMKGAGRVVAIDIDEWAYNNALENIRLNNTNDIQVALGGAEQIPAFGTFDIVFANINRNILLNDIRHYSECMKPGAFLYMSGFYVQDIPGHRRRNANITDWHCYRTQRRIIGLR